MKLYSLNSQPYKTQEKWRLEKKEFCVKAEVLVNWFSLNRLNETTAKINRGHTNQKVTRFNVSLNLVSISSATLGLATVVAANCQRLLPARAVAYVIILHVASYSVSQ